MSRVLHVSWIAVGLCAAALIPIRITEIAVAHKPKVSFCVIAARGAASPTFAFSHAHLNQGNLKDE